MILNGQRRVPVAVAPLEEFFCRLRAVLELREECVTVRLVGDREISRLNRDFRGKDRPTDVLSFPANGVSPAAGKQGRHRQKLVAGEGNSSAFAYLGDIAISVETARRNARAYGRTLPAELRILILHGVLHLLGYDHETDDGEMRRLERRMRRRLEIG